MIIDFDEKRHIYSINGEIASISVTELLSKHGLAPDYSGVSKELIRESSQRGKEIHEDCANCLNRQNYAPETDNGKLFKDWVEQNVDAGVAEQVIGFEFGGLTICGTADAIGWLKDGKRFVLDHKTTSSLHKEAVSWQVSLYDYFLRKLGNGNINGKSMAWQGADMFYAFHYKGDTLDIVELEKVPDSEIERLLIAEYRGETYQRPNLVIDAKIKQKIEKAEKTLASLEKRKKHATEVVEELRAMLVTEMKRQGIKSWETDKVRVTYVEPIDKITVDTKKLKTAFPMVYSECQKLTTTRASVRVKIKGDDDET